jgi:hypothetical protein
MTQTIEERNKALVLDAFDTLFNKRDYEAAMRFWSPNYIQHSAHIQPGRDGLFNLIKIVPATLRYEPGVILADKDFVIVQPIFRQWTATELDRGRRRPHRRWRARGALGRPPGRGHPRRVAKRHAHVWRRVPRHRRNELADPDSGSTTMKDLLTLVNRMAAGHAGTRSAP